MTGTEVRSAAEETVAGGVCTMHGGGYQDELLPWSGQRVCWDCFDQQLDLMALAIREAAEDGSAHVQVGQPVFAAVSA